MKKHKKPTVIPEGVEPPTFGWLHDGLDGIKAYLRRFSAAHHHAGWLDDLETTQTYSDRAQTTLDSIGIQRSTN